MDNVEKINIIIPMTESRLEDIAERVVYGDTEYMVLTFDAEDANISVNVHLKKEE